MTSTDGSITEYACVYGRASSMVMPSIPGAPLFALTLLYDLLKLIKLYLKSGVMENGVVIDTEEGSPQGGNLSPLRSVISC